MNRKAPTTRLFIPASLLSLWLVSAGALAQAPATTNPGARPARAVGGPALPAGIRAERNIPYIDQTDPPFLIMHGDDDQLVPLGQSVILAKALIEAGVEVTMKTIPGAGHEGPQFHTAESRRLIVDFLSRQLQPAK